MQWAKKQTGFTIVELLIVVVIIAILATITIVSYNGIQNGANDSAVQSDLRNFVTAAVIKKESGVISVYPLGNDTELDPIRFGFNRDAFDQTGSMLYCVNATQTMFAIYGRSKSKMQYFHTSDGRTGTTSVSFGDFGTLCSTLTGVSSSTYARYGRSAQGGELVWNSWTSR